MTTDRDGAGRASGIDVSREQPEVETCPDPSLIDLWANIPKVLKARCAWVCWRLEPDDEGRLAKVPHVARDGRNPHRDDGHYHAASTRPKTWRSFDEALQHAPRFDGIGIMFADGLCGVDLDHCRDPKTGELEPWARVAVEELGSYTEASPSGTGVHVLLLADLPPGRRRKGSVEVYGPGSPRFFTLTGAHLAGTPTTVQDRNDELAAFHARVLGESRRPTVASCPSTPSAPISFDDEILLAKARGASNGAKFVALFDRGETTAYSHPNKDGTGNDGRSEADLALACHLSFWACGNPARIDRLFRMSALYRSKWERPDYREQTIQQALQMVSARYSGTTAAASSLDLVRISNRLIDAIGAPKVAKLVGAIISASGAKITDEELAEATGRTTRTVQGWRRKLRESGLEEVTLETPTDCYASVPRALLFDARLSVGARVTGLTLARTMQPGGVSRAGQQALADHRATPHRQVVGRHLRDLEQAGYLVVSRSSFSHQVGRRKSCNRYAWRLCDESCIGQG